MWRSLLLALFLGCLIAAQGKGGLKGHAGDELFLDQKHVTEFGDDEIEALVTISTSDKPWLVNFYAPWCGHCQHFAPKYIEAADAMYGKSPVRFGAVSCTAHASACRTHNIAAYPTVKAFGVPGLENGFSIPSTSKANVINWVEKNINIRKSSGDSSSGSGTGHSPSSNDSKGGHASSSFPPFSTDLRRQILRDALSSLAFSFDKEVFLGSMVLGKEKLDKLRNFLRLLSISFPGGGIRESFALLLSETEEREELAIKDWDEAVERWRKTLTFSEPGKVWVIAHGYTSGLWLVFHILSLASGMSRASPNATMEVIRDYVENFFGCSQCRSHFLAMYDNCTFGRCSISDSDVSNELLVLWLWQLHNSVNVRVGMENAASKSQSFTWQDYQEKLWPRERDCSACWHPEEIGALGKHFEEEQYIRYIDKSADQNMVFKHLVLVYIMKDSEVDDLSSLTGTSLADKVAINFDKKGRTVTRVSIVLVGLAILVFSARKWRWLNQGRGKKRDSAFMHPGGSLVLVT